VIYIDNPVGTGFSYTLDEDHGYPNFVNQSSEDLYIALQQFFTIFDDFAQR
jgi:vitellogenic carboxypeptidase-like protein